MPLLTVVFYLIVSEGYDHDIFGKVHRVKDTPDLPGVITGLVDDCLRKAAHDFSERQAETRHKIE